MELLQLLLPRLLSFTLFFFLLLLVLIFIINKVSSKSIPPASHQQAPLPPPGPRRLPFIGNLHQILSSPTHIALRDLAAVHGPLMLLHLGQLDLIVASSAAAARAVTKTHDLSFSSRPSTAGSRAVLYSGAGLAFAPLSPCWSHHRRICSSHLLSNRRTRSSLPLIYKAAYALLSRIQELSSPIAPIDLSWELLRCTNAVTAMAAFGRQLPCLTRQEKFMMTVKEAMKIPGFGAGDLFPSLWFVDIISGTARKLQRLHKVFDEILDYIIEKHSGDHHLISEEDEDFVDILLRLQKDEVDQLQVPFTTTHVKALILDMFIGGTETTSVLLEWAMSELIRNPEYMHKAQAEARRVLGSKSDMQQHADDSAISELKYLPLVIQETLRLHPPLPLLIPRVCRYSCQVLGHTIPAGSQVVINGWAILRDPESWEKPDVFMPHRFESNSIDYKGSCFEYIPFGSGRRICPGMAFGITIVTVVLAKMLFHFDWELPAGEDGGESLDMEEEFGATMGRKTPLRLIAVPRIPL